jgi:glycosyltransferase involved in cell wall biosynthesis
LEGCVEKCLLLKEHFLKLELVIVDDCSKDKSLSIAKNLEQKYEEIKVLHHETNKGKGAALRSGFEVATGAFVGIQDADLEYNPMQYLRLVCTCLEHNADAVYGSRYLRPSAERRVLYFWHTWMNKSLTFFSNMCSNLDITDMETCYKLFNRDFIKKIAPSLKENRFGFEPEITAKVAQTGSRIYECAIDYNPRSYEEGKKIGWKDGFYALYCILHYSANTAPLPMQLLFYFFIGLCSLAINVVSFAILDHIGIPELNGVNTGVVLAYVLSTATNYLLCIAILFRHKARWSSGGEIAVYMLTVIFMGFVDYGLMWSFTAMGIGPVISKTFAAGLGFILNFALRRQVVFPEKKIIPR